MTEKQLQNEILREFGRNLRMRLWRANCGTAVVGDVGRIMALCRRAGIPARVVSFGVPGQADLTGIVSDGRRLEIEVKSPRGWQTRDQANYEHMIRRMGGVYVLARGVGDVREALGSTLDGGR